MNEILLRSYETFSEIPEGKLLVTEKSNLMYVRIGSFAFITREFFNSITNENYSVIYKTCYLNVKNHKKILEIEFVKHFNNNEIKILNKMDEIDIIPLSKILNIKGNGIAILSLSDVDDLLNFKGEFIPGKKISII